MASLNHCHETSEKARLNLLYHRIPTVSRYGVLCDNLGMGMEIRLKLGAKLRSLRKKYKYTQEGLSELSGVDYKHIQLLESKKPCAARIDTLEKLAKAFKISVSKLTDFK